MFETARKFPEGVNAAWSGLVPAGKGDPGTGVMAPVLDIVSIETFADCALPTAICPELLTATPNPAVPGFGAVSPDGPPTVKCDSGIASTCVPMEAIRYLLFGVNANPAIPPPPCG